MRDSQWTDGGVRRVDVICRDNGETGDLNLVIRALGKPINCEAFGRRLDKQGFPVRTQRWQDHLAKMPSVHHSARLAPASSCIWFETVVSQHLARQWLVPANHSLATKQCKGNKNPISEC